MGVGGSATQTVVVNGGVVRDASGDLLTADEFRNTNPGASRDVPAVAANVYRRVK